MDEPDTGLGNLGVFGGQNNGLLRLLLALFLPGFTGLAAPAEAKADTGAPSNNGADTAQTSRPADAAPPASKPADTAPAKTTAGPAPEKPALKTTFDAKSAPGKYKVADGERKIDYVIGDSLAWMTERDARYPFTRLDGGTKGGRPPENIVYAMERMVRRDPHVFEGRTILLSTGASNDVGRFHPENGPQRLDQIREELRFLKAHGAAAVIVMGVGPGKDDQLARMKGANGEQGYNPILQGVVDDANADSAGSTKFIFGGPVRTRPADPVHPDWRDYPELVRDLAKKLNDELPLPDRPIRPDPGQKTRLASTTGAAPAG
jgi:hypothetical protein